MVKQTWLILISLLIGGAIMGLNRSLPQRKISDLEYIYIENHDSLPDFAIEDKVLIQDLDDGPCLIITRGQKNCGGYQLELVSTEVEGDNLIIRLRTLDPKPGSMNIMVLTYPWVHVKTEGAKTYSVILNEHLVVEEQSL